MEAFLTPGDLTNAGYGVISDSIPRGVKGDTRELQRALPQHLS
jgi:hypothetical protein